MLPAEILVTVFFIAGIFVAVHRKNWRYFVAGLSVALIIVLWTSPQYPQGQKITMSILFVAIGGYLLISSVLKEINYKKTEYYKQTGKEFYEVNETKGGYGEFLISEILQPLESSRFRSLYNIYLPKTDGTTTEIDAVCITPVGIIVLESKNFSGWIFGNATQSKWTQTIYQERSQFYNPILQNKGHIRELSNFLGISENDMISVVIFSERCELKKVPENIRGSMYVIKRNEFSDILNDINDKRQIVFNDSQVDDIYRKLIGFIGQSDEVKQKHISDLHKEDHV